ncbi:hypothetical protein ABIF38_005035 [Bradyrhizobium japonicum]|uniref:hypothetical protein n=1 Tax=Bradyrhizobium elkanii TaxID=29448 RepID=UPI001020DDE7|nr:hypothetical protein [Bradyrhizobium elkanii]MCP1732652.1 hypothetical protein [Bradyrhizobium elkanii]MCS3567990.1 hypothetical protein [Bradyrhizobium elkanii]MCS3590527.1 hypothetical protein [Bradyrhizobium elkanii]MCS3619970.1 hypothetical protein [Bradyrhizobium elkanii]MCW2111776.1 hypothetical protein [Bradyrhizobium elkanii]
MNITVIFDPSVTNAGGPPLAFQNDVNAVVAYFESQYTDNITFNLHVGYGERDGTALGANSLGESFTFFHSYSYSSIVSALKSHSSTTDDSAAYATLPNTDPVTGGHTLVTRTPDN